MKNHTFTELDARGLACPLPLLKMKLALKDLDVRDKLRVTTTDKGSIQDFSSFCELSEHTLVSFTDRELHFEFVIEKG